MEHQEVSPLELFFDLVFVFAITQLSQHLLGHLSWRGVAETLVMLVGVFGVWSYMSFEASFEHARRAHVERVMLVVMAFGLFMNAAIAHAFEGGALAFVLPLLLVQIGRTALWTIPTAPTPLLRWHYARMLAWIVLSAPLWIVGALTAPGPRLGWWAVAAAIDLAGTWMAHPIPGRKLHSEHIAFDAGHMLERLRLFLIIALGEVVLTSGAALSHGHLGLMEVVAGALALSVIVSLWALYFAGSDHFVSKHVDHTSNPILAARLAVNGQVVVVAGLIALAVANEVAIARPREHPSLFLSLLMGGGALAYLLVQIWYLRFVTGRLPRSRVIAAATLLATTVASPLLPAAVALGLLALVLAVLWGVVARENRLAAIH